MWERFNDLQVFFQTISTISTTSTTEKKNPKKMKILIFLPKSRHIHMFNTFPFLIFTLNRILHSFKDLILLERKESYSKEKQKSHSYELIHITITQTI